MRRHSFWVNCYRTCRIIQTITLIGIPFIGVILKADPKSLYPALTCPVQKVQESAWWLILCFGIAGAITKPLCFIIGPPWIWETIERLFNVFREDAFQIGIADAVHDHRVTLFKRSGFLWRIRPWRSWFNPWGRWRYPWSGWLAPVARSGHTTQRTNTVFLAPDDADNVEGVCGRAWARDGVIFVENLPDLNQNPGEAEIKDYAKRTWVSVPWVKERLKKRKFCPRSLCGIPVEVNGKRWGVIVLDSRHPTGIKQKAHAWAVYRKLMPMLLKELLTYRG